MAIPLPTPAALFFLHAHNRSKSRWQPDLCASALPPIKKSTLRATKRPGLPGHGASEPRKRLRQPRFAYWASEPVCSIRVAWASPATLLPLWKVAALAIDAMAVVRLSAAKAARIMFFIGFLHPSSSVPSGIDGQQLGMRTSKVNAATQHWTYARGRWAIEESCLSSIDRDATRVLGLPILSGPTLRFPNPRMNIRLPSAAGTPRPPGSPGPVRGSRTGLSTRREVSPETP